MNAYSTFRLIILGVAGAAAGAAGAAEPNAAVVTAGGSSMVERQPTEFVMHIELIGRGKNLKEALANLDKRETSARETLKTLGARPDSISVGPPSASNSISQSRQQMEEMIRERIGRGGRTPEGLKLPESATVTLPLSASWPLKTSSAADLLAEAQTLTKKIADADLAGAKDTAGVSEEELELLEESAAEYSRYSGGEEVAAGTPQFFYRAQITEEDRRQALREAFAAAKKEAQELADAAGMKLGDLVTLASSEVSGGEDEEDPYSYRARAMAMMFQQRVRMKADRLSAQRDEPGEIPFMFTVQTTFRLLSSTDSPE